MPIAVKSSILNEAEFLDPSLKTWPCMKTSLVFCENQTFFLLFWTVATFTESHCVFCHFLQDDEVFVITVALRGSYCYLLFMDPVNGCSKSKLHIKEWISLKSKIRLGYGHFWKFLLLEFSTLINLLPTCWYLIKVTKHFVLSISSTDICQSKLIEKRWQLANCKLNNVN